MNRNFESGRWHRSGIEIDFRVPAKLLEPTEENKKQMVALGRRIRKQREISGYSLRRLADLCGVSRAHLMLCEHGGAMVHKETMKRLVRLLGVSEKYLKTGKSDGQMLVL